ncbi:MAG: hypothetical protein ACM3OF_13295 [Gemmatimonas sp.]
MSKASVAASIERFRREKAGAVASQRVKRGTSAVRGNMLRARPPHQMSLQRDHGIARRDRLRASRRKNTSRPAVHARLWGRVGKGRGANMHRLLRLSKIRPSGQAAKLTRQPA